MDPEKYPSQKKKKKKLISMLTHGLKESRQIVQEHKCLLRPPFLQSSGWKQHCISGKLCCFTKYCSLRHKPMSNSSDKGIISNVVTEKETKITQQLEPAKDKMIRKPKYSLVILFRHSFLLAMLPFYMSNYIERSKNTSILSQTIPQVI